MPLNTTYDLEAGQVDVGTAADSRQVETITGVAGEEILPGQAVGWDDSVLDTDAPMKGVARLSSSMVQEDDGTVSYKAGETVPLVSRGPIHVSVIGAVTKGALAYAFVSGANKGKFTATSGGTTTTAAVGWFETATSGDGQAKLFVQRF